MSPILAPVASADKPAAHAERPSRPRPKWRSHSLPSAVSLTTPAVRLVVVEAWAVEKPDGSFEVGHEIIPVVAIRSVVNHSYSQSSDRPDDGAAPTHEGLVKLGWRFDHTEVTDDPLVFSEEYAAIVPASVACGECSNSAYRVVPAPWPIEADPARLESVVRVVEEEARTKAAKWAGGGHR